MIRMLLKNSFFLVILLSWLTQLTFGSHYVSLRGMGQPKYKKKFSHFAYANPSAPKGGHLNLYTASRFTTVHPYMDVGVPPPYINLIHATLMKPARDNLEAAYPYLAESVSIDPTSTSVVFTLRKSALFHNGEPIQAEDVAFSFDLLKKEGPLSLKSFLQLVSKVEIIDGRTIRFIFQEPNRDLPYQLGSLPVFCKQSLKGKDWKKESSLIGSGPYKIQSYELGNFITYERIKNWWGESIPSNKGFYNFDEIKVTYYADSRVGFEAFKKGLVDWWRDERISNWYKRYDFEAYHEGKVKKISFSKPFYHGLTGFFMNTRRPPLEDIRVRKALSLVFDFEWLNRARFFNSYKRNTSIFMNSGYGAPRTMSAEEKKLAEAYGMRSPPEEEERAARALTIKNDRERFSKALLLLKEAGWVLRNGVLVSEKTDRPMVLDLVVPSSGHVPLFQHFLGNLKKVGIEAHIKGIDRACYIALERSLEFDLIFHFHPDVVIPGVEQDLFWASRGANTLGTFNLSGVSDPLVDDLVSKIKTAKNISILKTYTALLDRIITLGYYLIPGWVPQKSYVAYWRKLNVLPQDASLYEIDTWWVRTLEHKVH
jgi:microcin C transport system substrate-binding protein